MNPFTFSNPIKDPAVIGPDTDLAACFSPTNNNQGESL
jgi:hypothetical protein